MPGAAGGPAGFPRLPPDRPPARPTDRPPDRPTARPADRPTARPTARPTGGRETWKTRGRGKEKTGGEMRGLEFREKCKNCDESGRESTKIDETLYRFYSAGVRESKK